MDPLQALMKPLIDEFGFYRGSIAPAAITPMNSDSVVDADLPSSSLADDCFWRWNGHQWEQVRDARREQWLSPDALRLRWVANRYDDYAPSHYVRWHQGENPVVSPAEQLDAAKRKCWEQVKQARQSAEFGSFTCDGRVFDASAVSQSRILIAAQSSVFDVSRQYFWTLKDNSTVTLSAKGIQAVAKALSTHVADCHAQSRKLRALINAASSHEALVQLIYQA
jgi:hypothetical protein